MWLLQSEVRQALEAAIIAGATPTVEQQAQFEATQLTALSDGGSRLLKTAGNTAEISVNGVLTNKPNFMAMLFGGGNTTYTDIISAIGAAEQDGTVEKIELAIDSPGGEFAGLFELIEVIEKSNKPITARVSNMAASAAFAIATAADTLIAKNNSARFGSVGIVVDMRLDANKVSITSTNAPNKRPDISTEAGRAIVRAELDEVHSLFAQAIAKGRNTSVEKVNSEFGQGGMFLAEEALKRGMIDSVTRTPLQSVTNTNLNQTAAKGGDNQKVKVMELSKLKADHPEAYSAAVKVGIDQERDRVVAHVTMGESFGAMDTAVSAIKDGDAMTATLTAQYMAAGQNKTDINAAAGDGDAAGDAADGAGDDDAAGDADDVTALVENQLGVNAE